METYNLVNKEIGLSFFRTPWIISSLPLCSCRKTIPRTSVLENLGMLIKFPD